MKILTLEHAEYLMKINNGDLYVAADVEKLPAGLTVNNLYMSGCTGITNKSRERKKLKKLRDGEYVSGKYLFADNILTNIKSKKTVGQYTVYVGKIKGNNVVSDGVNYAHCDKLRDGIADLLFKAASDRGADQYKNIPLDTEWTVAEAVTAYRIITGACRAGSEAFVNGQRELKEKYTIRECIELTKGQYNAEKFAEFFGME